MTIGRRKFLMRTGAATLGLSLATLAVSRRAVARGRWGALVPDPEGILDLPEGFTYAVLEAAGDAMDDGYVVPTNPDGMACFPGPEGTLILMRNHENVAFGGPYTGAQSPPPEAYEPAQHGGVTRLVVEAGTFERISSNLVLIGTIRNCGGGPSPWGFISCEETTDINAAGKDGDEEVRHGYAFLCATDAQSVRAPQRIDGYGRYNHEAVAVDPSNHYAYLTEDRGDSALYRFVPDAMDEPFIGQLQALKVVGQDGFDTGNMALGQAYGVEWVDVDEPDPSQDSVRGEAHAKGAAYFVRGEGIWFFEGQVYVCSTSGGPANAGQIFRLIDGEAATLELVVESTDTSVLDKPDNITVAPWGEVFIAEDGGGDQYIRWLNDRGEVCDFGRNAVSESEFAGVCFSPDGRAMFVNIQKDGLTLVVTGPFPEREPGGEETGTGGEETGTGGEETGTGGEETDSETDSETGAGGEEGGESEDTGGLGVLEGGVDEGCGCSTGEEGSGGFSAAAAVTVVAAGAKLALGDGSRSEAD